MLIYISIILVFLLDFITKYFVTHFMSYGSSSSITPFFNIIYTKNLGVSFSLFYNNHKLGPWILGAISFAIIIFIALLLKKTSKTQSKISLSCVVGGALGNLFDRFYYGGVIDFLDFHLFSYHWPAFNIADIAIVLGLFTYWLSEK